MSDPREGRFTSAGYRTLWIAFALAYGTLLLLTLSKWREGGSSTFHVLLYSGLVLFGTANLVVKRPALYKTLMIVSLAATIVATVLAFKG